MKEIFEIQIKKKYYRFAGFTDDRNLILDSNYIYDDLEKMRMRGMEIHIVADSEEAINEKNSLFCCCKKYKKHVGPCKNDCRGRGFSYELLGQYRRGEKIAVGVFLR